MRTACDRSNCVAVAAGAFSFDGAARVVRLFDAPGDIAERAGLLCDRHLKTFTPPSGWKVRDDRVETSDQRTPRQTLSSTPVLTRSLSASQSVTADAASRAQPALDFGDGTDAAATVDRQEVDVGRGSKLLGDDDFERLLDADSPLLARAFRTALAGDHDGT